MMPNERRTNASSSSLQTRCEPRKLQAKRVLQRVADDTSGHLQALDGQAFGRGAAAAFGQLVNVKHQRRRVARAAQLQRLAVAHNLGNTGVVGLVLQQTTLGLRLHAVPHGLRPDEPLQRAPDTDLHLAGICWKFLCNNFPLSFFKKSGLQRFAVARSH